MRTKASIIAAAVILSALPAVAAARSETCRPTTEKEIASLFDRWNAALTSGDPQKVVANYAPNAVLLPTLSNEPALTQQQRTAYFTTLLKNKPVARIDSRTIQIDCNVAIDAGTWTFTLGDGSQLKARYTFVYRWDGKQWLIASHHSSKMPLD